MSARFTAKASIAALLVGLSLPVPAAAQTQTTIFTTTDFRQDRDRWTDPAYYRNNTPGQLRGMAINVEGRRTGQELRTASRALATAILQRVRLRAGWEVTMHG